MFVKYSYDEMISAKYYSLLCDITTITLTRKKKISLKY